MKPLILCHKIKGLSQHINPLTTKGWSNQPQYFNQQNLNKIKKYRQILSKWLFCANANCYCATCSNVLGIPHIHKESSLQRRWTWQLLSLLYHLPNTITPPDAASCVWTVSTSTTHAHRDSNPGLALTPDQEASTVTTSSPPALVFDQRLNRL